MIERATGIISPARLLLKPLESSRLKPSELQNRELQQFLHGFILHPL